ncbi:hypothetical protein Ciccas_013436 [Cichlidogyrus casuarinus]|uniref:Uncharacterized protein n=1 Tax=Cichlidogyrus casuarinus TaxID=1844966 RepID=A0ABD2PNN0_9PLAT
MDLDDLPDLPIFSDAYYNDPFRCLDSNYDWADLREETIPLDCFSQSEQENLILSDLIACLFGGTGDYILKKIRSDPSNTFPEYNVPENLCKLQICA